MSDRNNRRRFATLSIHLQVVSALIGLALTAAARAQSGGDVMVRHGDNGAPPQIMHFSMPDFMDLRTPDFLKRDLPTFTDKLVLSDDQAAAVQRLIENYLESFKQLVKEHLPKQAEGMQIKFGDDDGPNGGGGKKAGMIMIAPGSGPAIAGGDDGDFDLPDLGDMIDQMPEVAEMIGDGPHTMSVGVSMRVGGPDDDDDEFPGDAGADFPDSGVAISIDTPDGEIPEALRKKLEEAATKMAEELKAKMAEQIANGGQPGDAMPFIGPGQPMSIEDMQKRNDEMAAQAEAFRVAKAGLRQEFITNVQTSVLATPQIERWPTLERTLRRNKTLPKGRLSGERTDLVKVLKDIDLNEADRRAVAEPVDAYEVSLDNALKQRNDFIPACEARIDKAMQDNDPDKALTIIDRAAALRVAVRSINEQFTDAIAQQLPAEQAQKFRDTVQRMSFPLIYRTTMAQRTFAAARKIEGVDDKTLATINELEKAYMAELTSQNAQIRQAMWKYEPQEPRRPIEQLKAINSSPAGHPAMDGMMLGHNEQSPVREAFAKRRDLDDQYIKSIRDLLTPEQAEQLPKAPARRKGAAASEPLIIRRAISND